MRSHSRRGRNIDEAILDYLAKQDWPATTEMVARELKVSWNNGSNPPIQAYG